jgi:hypothetical protein
MVREKGRAREGGKRFKPRVSKRIRLEGIWERNGTDIFR